MFASKFKQIYQGVRERSEGKYRKSLKDYFYFEIKNISIANDNVQMF